MAKNENPGILIDEEVFSYKGPKPYSRETAVVMIVDSVEAASHSLKTYTPKDIDDLVENIIRGQIEQEQFSNVDLTFRDIEHIKKILKRKLQSIYHVRVEYPVSTP